MLRHDEPVSAPVLPSTQDPVVAGVVTALGGPPGRRARVGERRLGTPLRWLVLLTLLACALGWLQKSPCRVQAWDDEYQYTRACYTDVLALYYAERLSQGATPYLEHPVEYPVVIGGVMGAVAAVSDRVARAFPDERVEAAQADLALARARGGDVAAAERELGTARAALGAYRFYDATWAVLTGFAVVVTVTTARLAGRRRVWDAALFAAAPVLVLHGTTNWDLVAVALTGLGLLAWARRAPVAAGVLLGLATATKLYPVLLLVPLLALCHRAGRLRAGLRTAGALVATAGVLTGAVYLVSPSFAEVDGVQTRVAASPVSRLGDEGLAALAPRTTVGDRTGVNAVYRFVELNRTRPADWDSLAYALGQARQGLGDGWVAQRVDDLLRVGPDGPAALNAVTAGLTLLALAGVVLLALRAPRRPRLPQLLLLALVGFLLANKVWSPQYVLWLVPLVALARPRWGPFLAWMATECVLLLARFYYFVSLSTGPDDQASEGIGSGWFVTAVLLRDAALVAIAVAVVRDVLRPERDVVRAEGEDDPAGGLLDGAPDRRAPAPVRA